MKNSIALTLLIVVLANNVYCDRAPPVRGVPPKPPSKPSARPPVNNPGVVIPTRSTKVPTRQILTISRTAPLRSTTTVSGKVPVTTRSPPGPIRSPPPTVSPTRTPPTTVSPTRTPPTTVSPTRTPPTTVSPVTTTRQNIDLTTTTQLVPTVPSPPPTVEIPSIPTVPIATDRPPMSTLQPNEKTTLPPRVGPSFPDPRCPAGSGLTNPTQLPHHDDCNRFYKCDHGIAYEYRCPVGQHWNTARNWCDFPNLAGCSTNGNGQMPIDINNPILIPMAPPVLPPVLLPVSPPHVGGLPEPRCPHMPTASSPLGEMNLSHRGNCNKYLKCVQGLAYEYNCPTGLHWNPARDICDMPQSANCQLGKK